MFSCHGTDAVIFTHW